MQRCLLLAVGVLSAGTEKMGTPDISSSSVALTPTGPLISADVVKTATSLMGGKATVPGGAEEILGVRA